MSKGDPVWLPDARNFCREAKITITAWGPDILVVEAKSKERGKHIASQLGKLGFSVVESEDDSEAGILSFSLNPTTVHSKIASYDISRRRWDERMVPLLWAVCSLLLVPGLFGNMGRTPHWFSELVGFVSAGLFLWDAPRIWGWRLEILREGLRVRQYYRWSTVTWEEIHTVEIFAPRGGNREEVILKLRPRGSRSLGSFNFPFARNLRDRLRIEIDQRRGKSAS